jgi:transcriptional regulator with XRE-family HTH domain
VPQSQLIPTSHCFPSQTADGTFVVPDEHERTRISNFERTERDAGRRRRDATEWHDQTLRNVLRYKTDDKARLGLVTLLNELTAGYGLGWSDIARLVGVSVPAVRKWRHGGDITSPRLQSIARLAAFLGMLEDEDVRDPAAWLNLPIDDFDNGTSLDLLTKKEIYGAGGIVDLLAYAKRYISHDELLSRTSLLAQSSSHRDRVIKAPDGNLSIVPAR